MTNITACKIINQSNKIEKEEIVVCTTWLDSKIKVLIIRNNNTVLMGEIFLQEFCIYAKTFDKTLEDYVKETEDILSGKNDEVQFFLDNHKFYWKKNAWVLGQLNVKIINELQCLKDFTLLAINEYSKMKSSALETEKSNENLKSSNSQLIDKLNELIALKQEFEKTLYSKFLLLLNSKKAKIRELKSKLEKLENKNSVFDAETEESDNESNSSEISISHSNPIKESVNKRLGNEDIDEQVRKKRRQSEISLENEIGMKKEEIKVNKLNAEPTLLNANNKLIKSNVEPVLLEVNNEFIKLDIEPLPFKDNNESMKSDDKVILKDNNKLLMSDTKSLLFKCNDKSIKSNIEPVPFNDDNECIELNDDPVLFKDNNEAIKCDVKPVHIKDNNESLKSDIKPMNFDDSDGSIDSDIEPVLFEDNNEPIKSNVKPVHFADNTESIKFDNKSVNFENSKESMSGFKPVLFKCTNSSMNLDEDQETPDLLSDESECELELKFEEEKVEDTSNYCLNTIFQEDSEEEMF